MSVRYSPSTGFFYPINIEYQDIPSDVFEVSEADHLAAHTARASGGSFEFAEGILCITPPAAIPYAQVCAAYLDTVRALRDGILNRLAGIGFAAMGTSDAETVKGVLEARQALLDITIAPIVLAATDLDTLTAAMKSTYAAIIAAAPPIIREAFDPGAI
ncbi:hypothetical protein [Janthinobacterium sp. SUN137]|uniref:hypothetical protein n=1 Tax=Janthinobacterium sp. SUN137 TaxID=3014789 RepID=UPI0027132F26|nr:hypothetical protein [Janthinobacterium sp. SUN137]MDO8039517.1 hypothetical protein [Janthinobacterium sp. SUN137]